MHGERIADHLKSLADEALFEAAHSVDPEILRAYEESGAVVGIELLTASVIEELHSKAALAALSGSRNAAVILSTPGERSLAFAIDACFSEVRDHFRGEEPSLQVRDISNFQHTELGHPMPGTIYVRGIEISW